MGDVWRSHGCRTKLNVQSLYRKQIKLIGSNGSTRKEFNDVIDMSKESQSQSLEEGADASCLLSLFDKKLVRKPPAKIVVPTITTRGPAGRFT